MNRNNFVASQNEVISEIGDDFVFSRGQIFKEKPFDDEYIVLLEVGDQVNEQCDGTVSDGKVQYNACFWSCTPQGRPIKLTWHGRTTSEGFQHTDSLRKYYYFTGKMSPSAYLDLLEPVDDGNYMGRTQVSNRWISTVEREPKDRRTEQEKEEMERYEARMARNAMRAAGIQIVEVPYMAPGATAYSSTVVGGTGSSDISNLRIIQY